MIAAFTLLFLLFTTNLATAQTNIGDLRLRVTDPSGAPVRASVTLTSDLKNFRETYSTDESGSAILKRLPYGIYTISVARDGFAPFAQTVEIRTAAPTDFTAKLAIAASNSSIQVNETDTLIDPNRPGSVNRIGSQQIEDRENSLPGRSLQNLVNSQPGWIYEGNAVLHPRGSEYQTQFVIDGIPLTDNRSPGFGPEIEADEIQSLSIYTAGIPAEYGRKMGGVVEVNTARDLGEGFHGKVVLGGGSYDTAQGFASAQYQWDKNALGVTASGDMTSHYLNPVVPQNFTNEGTTGDFSVRYERDLTDRDRISLSVRHEISRYEIPNEILQQQAGNLQNGDNFETMGIVSYQHIFNPDVIGDFRGMVRDNANNLYSNPLSTPVIAFQHNYFREGYFKGTVAIHKKRHEIKVGIESDNTFLHEKFNDFITDPGDFDPDTPQTYAFTGNTPDLEQSAFIQDEIRLGKFTVSAGLRWDHYQLLVNQNAVSPRLGVGYYIPSLDLVFHATYDRIFQTPSNENLLISSSNSIVSLSDEVLRLPVKPSHGNYYEVGLSKGFFGHVRFDANGYARRVDNFADDDQLLSTAVSFPIAFEKAYIYGAEGKLEIPYWHRFSGFVSYSYMVASALPARDRRPSSSKATTPPTPSATSPAGLLGLAGSAQHRPHPGARYDFHRIAVWGAVGAEYGSGLPFRNSQAPKNRRRRHLQSKSPRPRQLRQRPRQALPLHRRLPGRRKSYRTEKLKMRLQADALPNLNNRLNVIDFWRPLLRATPLAPPAAGSSASPPISNQPQLGLC